MFKKIMIANRGEIAVRVMRTCREMGIRTVGVYTDMDLDSLHLRLADESYSMGTGESDNPFIDMSRILDIAEKSGAEAIHPGYGFLAENPDFAEMCEKRGITFIGPPSASMRQVKPKHAARDLMRLLNIPVVPGYDKVMGDSTGEGFERISKVAGEIGYPVLVKPSGGGGGIGMTVANNREELARAVRSVEQRGQKLFGVSAFYVEKLMPSIKHIEFQVLADRYGNAIHLGERDCSIQRRFQKLIEEAPCSVLPPRLRMKMGGAALDIALAMKYVNAMTVEFFYVPETEEFYFNEVNTRLQVEHCVTEMVTDVDIVKEQIKIAAGEPLSYTQDEITHRGYVIECRITAEDAARNFMPSPGEIKHLHLPHGAGIRIDEGIYEGFKVPYYYDSLLLKLMAWGKTRPEAINRMKRAIWEMKIDGIQTSLPFHRVALENDVFASASYTTDFIEKQNILAKVKESVAKKA